jgi:cell division protein FtsI/penicillin-binding protein 2
VRTGGEGSDRAAGMASTRKRGAHAAARPRTAPSAAPKRVPQPGPPGGRAPGTAGNGGKLVGGLRSRITLVRLVVAALLVGFVVAGMGDGWWSAESAEPAVQNFLLDWQQHSYAAAAAATTGQPAVVTAALKDAYSKLDAASFYLSMGFIHQHGNAAAANFTASVDLGQNGAQWTYQGHLQLRLTASGWKVVWSPSLINPALRKGLRLAMVSTTPPRMPLLDAAGDPLQTLSTAFVAGVVPGDLKHPPATAQALGQATRIDPTEILGWIQAAPRNRFLELLTMRPGQYHRLAQDLLKVPGLTVHPAKVLLFTSIAPGVVGSVGTETSAALRDQGIAYRPGATVGLSGLQRSYQDLLAGTPTMKVVTEKASGRQVSVLRTWRGRPPTAVRTTIDASVQRAATRAVMSAPGAAAIVALNATTGRILAVAGHSRKGMPTIDPLNGRYPPGGAFTIVSTEALLASGLHVNRSIPCLKINRVGGRNFYNVPVEPNLGNMSTFAVDFAHSCGTAFAGLSYRGGMRQDLANAARGFGLGAPWQLPLPSFSGQVGLTAGPAQLAEATTGQGIVHVSPLTMAAVAAQVDNGIWHEPSLVTNPDPVRSQQVRFSASTMASLRVLMREAVRSGAAKRADVGGAPVYGQVGTTSLGGSGRHQRWATWFVGYRGATAFAVLEFSASSRVSAVPIAAHFLQAAPGR